ncbi:hypothetical protein GCM10007925_04030 [Sphingomonas astaxanthinifaciens DSM 22298]|uniref:Uncharacterized protein n=1 Tax=Sphingomonas astaxanthinifaciens DSM 22298 TaxID=1123267 RepID=A0ABQ5Z5B6_9SPHN|nr:hypothetical protein GCM10007925_04030 [Sphingomonas astaxanthinifaciens DSM 22298]
MARIVRRDGRDRKIDIPVPIFLVAKAARELAAAAHARLAPGFAQAFVDRSFRAAELDGDRLDGMAGGEQPENLEFPVVELGGRAHGVTVGKHMTRLNISPSAGPSQFLWEGAARARAAPLRPQVSRER